MRFGTFEVVEQVGVGSTGTVFRARELGSGRLVALKQLSAGVRSAPQVMDRLRAEAAVLASLDDPHVVALLGVGLEDDPPWIAVQWVQGASLDRVLQVYGRLSGEQAVGVLRGAVQGLAHAHSRGVVHRDVAPGNVLLDTAGTSMLVDFGLAAPVGTGGVCGTPAFLSPEAAAGAAVGPAGDVYSAAAVLFLLLTGRPPFPAGTVGQVLTAHRERPAPPLDGERDGLADLVARCLSKEATGRPPDGAALLAELDEHATRRYGTGWLSRATITSLIPTAIRTSGTSPSTAAAAGGAHDSVTATRSATDTGAAPQPHVPNPGSAAGVERHDRPATRGTRRRRRWTGRSRVVPVAAASLVVLVASTVAVLAVSGDDQPRPLAPGSPVPAGLPVGSVAGQCAQPGGVTGGAYVLTPACGPVGTTVTVTGGGCTDTGGSPDGRFAFYNNVEGDFSGAQQTAVDITSDGSFAFTFVVPAQGTRPEGAVLDPLPPGDYSVEISCNSSEPLTGTFTVVDGSSRGAGDQPGTTTLPDDACALLTDAQALVWARSIGADAVKNDTVVRERQPPTTDAVRCSMTVGADEDSSANDISFRVSRRSGSGPFCDFNYPDARPLSGIGDRAEQASTAVTTTVGDLCLVMNVSGIITNESPDLSVGAESLRQAVAQLQAG